MAESELFLEREGHGGRWHFSLHRSGLWHMKEGRKERLSWERPDEVVSGYVTLREVHGRNDRRYTQWVYDVRDTWLIQSAGEEIPHGEGSSRIAPSA